IPASSTTWRRRAAFRSVRPRRDPPAALDFDRFIDRCVEIAAGRHSAADDLAVHHNLQFLVRLERASASLHAQLRLTRSERNGVAGLLSIHGKLQQRIGANEGAPFAYALDPGVVG